jgi:hypothetical protein
VYDHIRTLVGRSCLRTLGVFGQFWEAEQLFRVFAGCTTRLERINFVGCTLSAALPPSKELKPFFARPKIRHLSLMHASALPIILADPACPLDLSSLVTVQCHGTPINPILKGILSQARSTITTLHFGSMGTCSAPAHHTLG